MWLTLCLIHATCLKLNLPRSKKHFKIRAGWKPCTMNFISFREMMFGLLIQDQKVLTSSAQNRYSIIKLIRKEMSFAIKPELLLKVILKSKGLIDETFAPMARIESIRILLALACHLKFKLYQMDVKSAFLNRFLKEEVYVLL